MTLLPPPPKPTETASATRFANAALLMSMVATLAACGGGGGGGSDTPSPPPASGSVVISGVATFESVPSAANGSLNYAGATDKPIRGATVQLLSTGGTVIATTTTDPVSGAYSVTLPTAQAATVRVRAEIKRTDAATGNRDISVLDNTNSSALYTLDAAVPTPTTAAVTTNLRAASGWGGSSYTGARTAGPFAILDTAFSAQAKIQSVATVDLPVLHIFWSVNNRPADGNIADGNIGTSYFTTQGGRSLYILGAANTDTDEYDTHVIAHEFGHYLQSAVSRDDSIGGSHGGGDKLDQRVSFSEGWGNGWSGIALGSPIYADSAGSGQASGFIIDVSAIPSMARRGAFSEDTAQYLVWSSNAAFGFGPVYSAFTSLATTPYWTTLYSFAAGLKGPGAVASGNVNTLWNSVLVDATDALGSGETNNGGSAATLPVYKIQTAATQNYCLTDANDPAPSDGNKLGEYVYVRFTVASGMHNFTMTKTSAGGATTDPDFVILKADGSTLDFISSTVDVETATGVNLSAGTYTAALTDDRITINHASCFNFTVN